MSDKLELDWLKKWHELSGDRVAFLEYETQTEYTYTEVFALVNRVAQFLLERGVQRGDRVAVLSRNRIEMVFLFFACMRVGAILVPLNFRLTTSEVDYILNDSGAKTLFYSVEFDNIVEGCKAKMDDVFTFGELAQVFEKTDEFDEVDFNATFDTCCKILYTSGTTGFPKGAMVTHKMLFWNSVSTGLSLNLVQDDCTMSFAPLFHTGGWNVLLTPFIHRGAKTVFLKDFDLDQILDVFRREKITIFFGVPTMLDLISRHGKFDKTSFESVRYAVVGGEPMPIPLIHTWANRGVPVRQGFGLTEFGPNCFSLREDDALVKSGSIGKPNFYIEVRIVDDQGDDVEVGEIGELILRGPMCMKGYWQDQKATRETIKDGWLHTGDLIEKDDEGYYFVAGRKKEMYISGGENVYPAEIEKALNEHPLVREAAVLGVPDSRWGEVGKAFVVCEDGEGVDENGLEDYCRGRLAKYKVPKHFMFLKSLPKGDSGKILKRALI